MYADEEAPPRQPPLGLIAFGIAFGLFAVLGIVAVFVSLPGRSQTAPSEGNRTTGQILKDTYGAKAAAPVTASVDGPWPECAAALAWLKENTADPAALQIIRWEGKQNAPDGGVNLTVKFRGRDTGGNLGVFRMLIKFKDGVYVNHWPLSSTAR